MNRTERILRSLAIGTVPFVGLFVCWFLLQAGFAVSSASRQSISALGQLNTALTTINRSCGSPGHIQPCGTLAEIDKLATHTSDLIVQSQVAVHHADVVSQTESQMLPKWNQQITATLGNVNQTAFDASRTLNVTSDSLQTLTASSRGVMDHASAFVADLDSETKPVISQANVFLANANTLATNPNIPTIMARTADILTTGNHMLFTLDKVEDKETHCILYPGFKCVVTGLIVPSVQIGGAAVAAFRK